MHYWHRMTANALAKNLDWYQHEPTLFISICKHAQAASHEAQRRMSHQHVPRSESSLTSCGSHVSRCRCADYQLCRNDREKFFSVRRCRCGRIWLPPFVLVRICVVANSSNDKTWKAVHQSRRLHLEAEYIKLSSQ